LLDLRRRVIFCWRKDRSARSVPAAAVKDRERLVTAADLKWPSVRALVLALVGAGRVARVELMSISTIAGVLVARGAGVEGEDGSAAGGVDGECGRA
jgi:hypothetical protein